MKNHILQNQMISMLQDCIVYVESYKDNPDMNQLFIAGQAYTDRYKQLGIVNAGCIISQVYLFITSYQTLPGDLKIYDNRLIREMLFGEDKRAEIEKSYHLFPQEFINSLNIIISYVKGESNIYISGYSEEENRALSEADKVEFALEHDVTDIKLPYKRTNTSALPIFKEIQMLMQEG